MESPNIKQILLITDGCSNKGERPEQVAALAFAKGISVNVIGVIDQDEIDDKGVQEIEAISRAGGGIHQIVYAEKLSQTVQMVTRQAMTQTIQGVVNKQLQQIFGKETVIEDLPPERRGEVMEVVDELGETANMKILILIDTSASMSHKLPTVKEALFDLSISLNSRTGDNSYSVYAFPGKKSDVEMVLDWTSRLDSLTKIFARLNTGGYTPTGPALREALSQFTPRRAVQHANDEEYGINGQRSNHVDTRRDYDESYLEETI